MQMTTKQIRRLANNIRRFALPAALLAGIALASPAAASVTIGQIASDDNANGCFGCSQIGGASTANHVGYSIPGTGGVITSWTFRARGAAGTARLRIFQPIAAIVGHPPGAKLLAESADASFALGETKTVPVRIPVAGGGLLGIAVNGPAGLTTSLDPSDYAADFPYATPVGGETTITPTKGVRLALSATLEPDADQDGYGDETQDQCRTDPSTQGPCGGSAHQPAPGATPDTTAPLVVLAAPPKESLAHRRIYLFVSSSEAGTGAATASIRLSKLAKAYKLPASTKALSPGAQTKLVIKVPRDTARAIARARAKHAKVRATISVTVRDGAGNAITKTVSTRLS